MCKQGRAAERILLAAVHGLQRVDEIRKVLVLLEQIEDALDRLLDVILEHGDDQFVLARRNSNRTPRA